MRCEDFPCCGHETGCCPDYDESGRQLNMRCTCGAVVDINSRSSLCESCLNSPEDEEYQFFDDDRWDEDLSDDPLHGEDDYEYLFTEADC